MSGIKSWLARKILEREVKGMAEKVPRAWRTTLTGVGLVLLGLGQILPPLLAGAEVPWTAATGNIVAGIGLILARDNKS